MNIDWSAQFRRVLRILRTSIVPALALGYTAFYSIYPSATFPVSSDASFGWILLVLLTASVVGGMQAEYLQEALVAAVAALPLGFALAVLLAFTPGFAGLYLLEPSAVPFFIAHFAILVLVLSFPVNLLGAVIGQLIRDRFRASRAPNRLSR